MLYIYTTILYLLTPFLILRLYWKSWRLPAYRHRIRERFFLKVKVNGPIDVWIHAVSLGEVVAAVPLIHELLSRNLSIMVTTMTPTGSQQVIARFGSTVSHHYLPYDLPSVVRRFYKTVNPRLGIIMETEIWPNLIVEAQRCGIPLLLLNARLSDGAYRQYLKVRVFFKPLLKRFSGIIAQSQEDAHRFMALGAPSTLVQVGGNIKFDQPSVVMDPETLSMFTKAWGQHRVILIAASTHEGEEQMILNRIAVLQQAIPGLLLLIAPRHPERFQSVYQYGQQHRLKTGLRSRPETIDEHTQVVVLDSLGELTLFYALSHYAFVGGSLVPIGGHNVLEAIAVNVPVFCGPYMNNAQSICDDLRAAHAIEQAANADELVDKIIALHHNPQRRERQLNHAMAVLKANQGALNRCLIEVDRLIRS